MTLQEQIQEHLTEAMKNRDVLRLSVLRMAKTALMNKKIEKMKDLDSQESIAVLLSLVKQRKDSAEQFRQGGRAEMAAQEEQEITILEQYLPAPASDEDIQLAIEAAVRDTGATSVRDMGKVMKAALAGLTGKTVDGARLSQSVKDRLGR